MAKAIIDPNKDFEAKLKEVSDAYEDGKDAVYSMMSNSTRYETDRAVESLRKLRDIAAISLRSNFNIKNN